MSGSTPPRSRVQLPGAEQRERASRAEQRAAAAPHACAPQRAPPARARAARRPRRRCARRGRGRRHRQLATHAPGRGESTTTRSASTTASSTSWVTSTTVRGSRASAPASQSCISARVIASSAPNGSSRHSTGLPDSSVRSERHALAHAARELAPGARRSKPSRPSSANSGARARARRARDAPAMRSAQRRVVERARATAAAGRAGASARRARLRPCPASGACSPQISSSSVDLPQPLGPDDARAARRRGAAATCRERRARRRAERRVTRADLDAARRRCAAARRRRLCGSLRSVVARRSLRGHYPTGSKGRRRGNRFPGRHLSRPSRQPPWCRSLCADASSRRPRSPAPRRDDRARQRACTKSSSCAVVQHSNAVQYCS